jgi:hypothetical protein
MNPLAVVIPEPASLLIVAVGWALVYFLGQGLLIALGIAALLRALNGRSADLRYGVACIGLLAMALCPIVTTASGLASGRREATRPAPRDDSGRFHFEMAQRGSAALHSEARTNAPDFVRTDGPSANAAVVARASVDASPRENKTDWRARIEAFLPFVVAAWLTGVCLLALRMARGFVEVQALARVGLAATSRELKDVIDRLIERAGVSRTVSWFLSRRVEVPSVVG